MKKWGGNSGGGGVNSYAPGGNHTVTEDVPFAARIAVTGATRISRPCMNWPLAWYAVVARWGMNGKVRAGEDVRRLAGPTHPTVFNQRGVVVHGIYHGHARVVRQPTLCVAVRQYLRAHHKDVLLEVAYGCVCC